MRAPDFQFDELHTLQNLCKGDIDAFDSLYELYKQRVYANIYKMVQNASDAEDILQEVFLSLWQNRHKIAIDKSVAGWLFVVSYNKAITHLKKSLKETLVMSNEISADHYITDKNNQPEEELYQFQLSLMEDAIQHLSSRKKEVFYLCKLEGKSHREVASTLGISETSVKDYLKQATRSIKDYVSSKHSTSHSLGISLILIFLAH